MDQRLEQQTSEARLLQHQTARQIRALYNYNVGQKAGLGWVLLLIGGLAGLVFFLASLSAMAHAIALNLFRMH